MTSNKKIILKLENFGYILKTFWEIVEKIFKKLRASIEKILRRFWKKFDTWKIMDKFWKIFEEWLCHKNCEKAGKICKICGKF